MNQKIEDKIRDASDFLGKAQLYMKINDVEKAVNCMNSYYDGMKTLYDQNPNDDRLATGLALAAGQMALFWDSLDEQEQVKEYCKTSIDIHKLLINKYPNLNYDENLTRPSYLGYNKGYLQSLIQMGNACFELEEFLLGKNYITEAKLLADKLAKEYPEDREKPIPISQIKAQCDMIYEKIKKIDDYLQKEKPQEEDTRLDEKDQKMTDFSKQVDELLAEDMRLLEKNQNMTDFSKQVDEPQEEDTRLDEMLQWEKNMTMSSVNQYINYFYSEENNENGDDILKQIYLANSNSEEIKESNKQLSTLNGVWADLYVNYQAFKNNLSCSISKINKDDLFPYCSFDTIRKLKKELVILWLNLKQKYPQKLASICLSDDDGILDVAENESDNQITLLLISIVECNLELEGAYLNNNSYLLRHKRDCLEQQVKREDANSTFGSVANQRKKIGIILLRLVSIFTNIRNSPLSLKGIIPKKNEVLNSQKSDSKILAEFKQLENQKLYFEAYQLIEPLAQKGNAEAQYNLGRMYHYGNEVTKNYTEAVKWYRKSAEQGNKLAQCNLGYMYQNGNGVTKDYAEAIKWYQKSAEQGDEFARNNLGNMYYYGKGVTKDYTEAAKWFRKSAKQGNANAQNNLGKMYEFGNGVTKDLAEAVKWYRKVAEQGNAETQWYLGSMYEDGRGVTRDYTEAAKWYRKSAEQGNSYALYKLGKMYENGYGVTKDYTEAAKWYRKSAEQGNEFAQNHLGYWYQIGQGVAKDLNEAIKWYRKSANQGYAPAKTALKELGITF